jgi:post-segregation antitoxin (ccd killing protein)
MVMRMTKARINVTVDADRAERARAAGLNLSAVLDSALEKQLRAVDALAALDAELARMPRAKRSAAEAEADEWFRRVIEPALERSRAGSRSALGA